MKLNFLRRPFGHVAVLLGCHVALTVSAAATNSPARPATNAPALDLAAVQAEIPKSIFAAPRTPKEGKDPFFPTSTRMFAAALIKPTSGAASAAAATASLVELSLKGFSGPSSQRLVIINNRTFAAGETAEVRTPNGPVRVRCLQIKEDSVIIQVGAERRELRLRNGA